MGCRGPDRRVVRTKDQNVTATGRIQFVHGVTAGYIDTSAGASADSRVAGTATNGGCSASHSAARALINRATQSTEACTCRECSGANRAGTRAQSRDFETGASGKRVDVPDLCAVNAGTWNARNVAGGDDGGHRPRSDLYAPAAG